MAAAMYPLRVDAHLEPGLNRWLWLVKWLLVIPHYIVLAFLWAAFVVLSVIAFVAILITGRYPRAIFDFNVGVLRWSWRVAYYAYSALGTDRYPPFTLAEVPDYPTHLEVSYPERLSRGLVLVKWWLLALPHYLVVAFLAGSGVWIAFDGGDRADQGWAWGGGLIGLLVLVAAVVLLFTGRYPQQIFDLVLGLNRWVLRVAAYAALMTDDYPPFRLDMGGDEPGDGDRATLTVASPTAPAGVSPAVPGGGPVTRSALPPEAAAEPLPMGAVPPEALPPEAMAAPETPPGQTVPPQTVPQQGGPVNVPPQAQPPGTMPPETAPGGAGPGGPPAPPSGSGWGAGRVILVVLGSVVMLIAFGFGAAGATLGVAGAALRDDAGFLMTGQTQLVTGTSALASDDMHIDVTGVPNDVLGDAKLEVTSRNGAPVFIGLAPTDAANRYLSGVGHATVRDFNGWAANPEYTTTPGGSPATAPGDAGIWTASASGPGRQSMTWPVRSGSWTIVVMNADGSRGVNVDAAIGAEVPALGWVAFGLIATGVVGAIVALVLLWAGLHRRQPTAPAQPPGPPAATA